MTPTRARERFTSEATRALMTETAPTLAAAETKVRLSPDLNDFRPTDLWNAERLTRRHGRDLKYCHPWAKWLVWDGRRWKLDDSGEVYRRAAATARELYVLAGELPTTDERTAVAKHASRCEAKVRLDAMVKLTAHQEAIAITPDAFDRKGTLLNCRNGTLDLKNGELRPHDRADLITKMVRADFDPEAQCTAWLKFLHRIFAGDIKLINFVRRSVGYSLTANTGEQCLFILHGTGANGKSTALETLLFVLGDYGLMTPSETLLLKRQDGIPNDVARLRGARYVAAIETEENRRLAESRIKAMTGGDTITARYMRGEWFEFRPEFKLWLGTNHRPNIKGTDLAIWQRIRLVPFNVTIPPAERDPELPARLRAEASGILRWALSGCLEWQETRLQPPDTVRHATAEYREAEDQLRRFLDECCETGDEMEARARPLYAAYKTWAMDTGERPLTERAFAQRMPDRGFGKRRTKVGAMYLGIAVQGDG